VGICSSDGSSNNIFHFQSSKEGQIEVQTMKGKTSAHHPRISQL
jgi:hypothetical protein